MTRTRYKELSYEKIAGDLWRICDAATGAHIGPLYRSKGELLADLDRYARVFGCEGAGPPSQEDMGLAPPAEGIQPQDYTVVALFIGRHPGIRVIDIEHVRACSANQAGQMLKQQYEGTERGPDRVEQVEIIAIFPGKHEDAFDHSKV